MSYKKYFDIPEDIIYFNTPGNGLLPKTHLNWRRDRDREFFAVEDFLRDQQPAFVQQAKQTLARFFKCQNTEIFCTPSFTWGFKTFLDGLPKDSTFLLLKEDYPSVNYPVISKGFKHFMLEVDARIEDRIYDYIRIHRPSVFSFSMVQYISGLKFKTGFIKILKRDFPELVIVGDGTQWLGTVDFDFAESGFDAIGSSGYKWLLSGFGNGFFMIKERLQERLFPTAQKMPRPTESFYTDKSLVAIQYETGHLDTLALGTLEQSVLFLEEIGMNEVENYLSELSDYAHSKMSEQNLLLPLIEEREEGSTLINIQIDPKNYETLTQAGVRCFPRGTGIRIGLHLYNTKEEVDQLLDIIKTLS